MTMTARRDGDVDILLGFGSNLGDRRAALSGSLRRLQELAELRGLRCSRIYATAPYGVTDQPDFLNMAVRAHCALPADELLRRCKAIEQEFGRRPRERWHAREIDIDILLYGREQISTAVLTVPHPQMHLRRFVLLPAADVAADMIHAGRAADVAQLLELCGDAGRVDVFGAPPCSPDSDHQATATRERG